MWTRPYLSDFAGTLRYAVATILAFAGLLPVCTMDTHRAAPWAWIPVVLFVALWETTLWRVTMVGLYVSDYGIRVRLVASTRTIAWSAVDRVWAGPAGNYNAWAIWISDLDSGRDIETPIWRRGSLARHRNREKLNPAEFVQLLDRLNAEVANRAPRSL